MASHQPELKYGRARRQTPAVSPGRPQATWKHRALRPEKFGRKFTENTLQRLLIRHGLEVDTRFPRFADRQRPRRVTSDMTKQTDNVLRRNLVALSDLGKMCFRKQIGKPG